ncbi:hypothetical protein D3C80_140790 [compost metagenome]
MRENIHAADNRGVDLTAPERTDGLVQCDKGGRTCRIDRQTRPVQSEYVRDAVGNNRQGIAGHKIRAAGSGVLDKRISGIQARCANIDANALLLQHGNGEGSILQGAPRKLQNHALLRIHICGFAGSQIENCGIEIIDVLDHAGSERICLSWCTGDGMPETGMTPPVFGNAGYNTTLILQQLE